MAERIEIAEVVTKLTTEGGDKVRTDLQSNARDAEEAQRRLNRLRGRDAGADMMADIDRSFSAQEARYAAARSAMPNRPTPPTTAKRFDPMIDRLKGADIYRPESMAERLSTWSIQERQKAEAKSKVRDEDVAGERGASKEELLGVKRLLNLNKATEAETAAKQKLVKVTGDTSKTIGKFETALALESAGLLRLVGLAGTTAVGAGIVGGAIASREQYLDQAKRGAELTNPGVAYQARRAELDLEATENRHKVGALQEQTEWTRIRAKAFEQAEKEGGWTAWKYKLEQNLGMRAVDRWIFDKMTGIGPGGQERALAAKNPSGGVNAIDPQLGQFFNNGNDLYRTFASQALTNTPLNDQADQAGEKSKVPWVPNPVYDPTRETWGQFRRRQDEAWHGKQVADHFWKDILN